MNPKKSLKITVLLRFALIFLLSGFTPTQTFAKSPPTKINQNAFVYILNLGISGNSMQYKGLRNGFAVGDGQYILTAAHCVADFESTNEVLRQPMVISPYYGDIFEAEIVAVDEANDIAILKPIWDRHPALELETSDDWKKNKTLKIVGYPPTDKERGGNGVNYCRRILSEEVSLRYTSGKNVRAVVVGPCHYPGVGWSGSPFINPNTGKVTGIFCRGDTYQFKKYFFFKREEKLHSGPAVDSIRQLFNENNLNYKTAKSTMADPDHWHRFEQILTMLDTFRPNNKQKIESSLIHLCSELPDSCIVNTFAGSAIGDPNNLSHFEHAIKISPESSYVHAAYGSYLMTQNKPEKAVEQFQFITEKEPNNIFACHGLLSALVKTDPNAAEELGQELTRRWPENAGFRFEYSKALRANNKRQEELPVIQKAIELCGEGNVPFQYWRYLADSLKANKQYEKSEQAYQTLLEMHECDRCWWAYTLLLLEMGPGKTEDAEKARDKTMTFIQDPNAIANTQRIYDAALERMLSDPNTPANITQ